MRADKMKTSKLKIAIVLGILCCMAFGMTVMAFDQYISYTVGSNETKTIARFVPQASTICINTRPSIGDVTIYLSGAANGSATFPYNTSRNDWVVSVSNPTAMLTIRIKAGPNGASGYLCVRR